MIIRYSQNRKDAIYIITQCVETGERFASQNRAAEVFGGTASRMSEHLRGARENFNGYHFIRVQEFVTA
jgi:predicted XRE-type DNA-binding protein